MTPIKGGWALLVCLALVGIAAPSSAQVEDNVLGLSDENLESYVTPLRTGLSGTMSSAVFRSGYVPKQEFEFSIGAAAMAVGFDDGDRVYVPVDPVGFTSLEETEVPTIIGDLQGAIVAGENELSHAYPGGFDLSGFEIAVPQLSIGSFYGTRAIVRFIAMDIGDSDLGDFSYYGVGGQHSITQYFRNAPVDVAAGVFYQNFRIGDDIVRTKALQLNLTASRQYGKLQPYIGLGYDSVELSIEAEDEDDPELSVDATLDKETNVHFTAGLMARLSVVGIFAEYNAAAANGFALGLELGKMGGASYAH